DLRRVAGRGRLVPGSPRSRARGHQRPAAWRFRIPGRAGSRGELIGVTTPQHPARPALALVPGALGETITERIGNTALLRVRLFEHECPDVSIYAKAEFMNPGGSVKDRPALR